VAPEVFWRQGEGIDLDSDVAAEFEQAIKYMQAHDFVSGLEDIKATIAWARSQGAAKVGLVGYCMGGLIAYQTSARTDIDAAVGYYGVGISQLLDEAPNISKPLMLHVPTADGFVPPEQQKAVHEGLDSNPHVTIHDYEGLDHGFAAEHGLRRDATHAEIADSRTEAFFAAHLG
jgi:carboxymethylenebutenolidase